MASRINLVLFAGVLLVCSPVIQGYTCRGHEMFGKKSKAFCAASQLDDIINEEISAQLSSLDALHESILNNTQAQATAYVEEMRNALTNVNASTEVQVQQAAALVQNEIQVTGDQEASLESYLSSDVSIAESNDESLEMEVSKEFSGLTAVGGDISSYLADSVQDRESADASMENFINATNDHLNNVVDSLESWDEEFAANVSILSTEMSAVLSRGDERITSLDTELHDVVTNVNQTLHEIEASKISMALEASVNLDALLEEANGDVYARLDAAFSIGNAEVDVNIDLERFNVAETFTEELESGPV